MSLRARHKYEIQIGWCTFMSEKIQIKSFVSDLITQVVETAGPIERQIEDETVKTLHSLQFFDRCPASSQRSTAALRTHLDDIGGEPSTGFKAAVNGVFTAAISMVHTWHRDHVSEYLKEESRGARGASVILRSFAYIVLSNAQLLNGIIGSSAYGRHGRAGYAVQQGSAICCRQ